MQDSLSSQLFIFVYSFGLGLILGVAYDIFRIIRMLINSRNISIFIQDVLYFIISGILTFLFVLGANDGDSRLYIFAGEALGWILYHLTIGEIVYRFSGKFIKWIKLKIRLVKQWFRNIFFNKDENNK